MRMTIDWQVPHDEIEIANVINHLAEYLESDKPVPNHWEPGKRQGCYNAIYEHLTYSARTMCEKLTTI